MLIASGERAAPSSKQDQNWIHQVWKNRADIAHEVSVARLDAQNEILEERVDEEDKCSLKELIWRMRLPLRGAYWPRWVVRGPQAGALGWQSYCTFRLKGPKVRSVFSNVFRLMFQPSPT